MHTATPRGVPGVVRTAAWIYVLRRAAIAAAILGAVGVASFMVLMAAANSLAR